MRARQEVGDAVEVERFEGDDALEDAAILVDDMAAAPPGDRVEAIARRGEFPGADVAQGGRARAIACERRHALLALPATPIVLAVREAMAHAAVDHDEAQPRGQAHGAVAQRAAIEKQGAAAFAEQRGHRVHDAAARTDEAVLGVPAKQGEFDRIEGCAGERQECPADGDEQCCRGTQPGADRDLARDPQVRPAQRQSGGEQRTRDTLRMVAPVAARRRVDLVEIQRDRLDEVLGLHDELAVAAGHGRDPGGAVERHREDETLVVVGVLADQIHPARGTHRERPRPGAVEQAPRQGRKSNIHARRLVPCRPRVKQALLHAGGVDEARPRGYRGAVMSMSLAKATDASGVSVRVPREPRAVVSLVPSVTETLCALGLGDRLVGVTDWCIHPANALARLPRVRGTKNPDLDAIAALRPDLVLANLEENRAADVSRLRERGIRVWVDFPRRVAEAVAQIRWLADLGATPDATAAILDPIDRALEAAEAESARADRPLRGFVAVWKDPWMTASADTYVHDLLAQAGIANLFGEAAGRYPRLELGDLAARDPEVVLLPDEPYRFGEADARTLREGPLAGTTAARAGGIRTIDGTLPFWHGPRLARALEALTGLAREVRTATGHPA